MVQEDVLDQIRKKYMEEGDDAEQFSYSNLYQTRDYQPKYQLLSNHAWPVLEEK